MKKFENIIWGVILVILGLIFGLNALGITNINIFFDGWWTLFIIIPSIIELAKGEDKTWCLIWLAVGIVLLLCAQDILSFALIGKLIFPAILVAAGIGIIFKSTLNGKVKEKIKTLNSNREKFDEYIAIFGEKNNNLSGQEFNGANLSAVFGSIELDMTGTIINKDTVINANCVFGGIDIKAPEGVNIKVKSTPIFGGVSNKTKVNYNENLPTLYINGLAIFGGVDIK